MLEFETAKMDKRTAILTAVLLPFLLIFPICTFFFKPQKITVSIFVLILLYVVIFIAYAYRPQKIILNETKLQIKTLLKSKTIELNAIKTVEKFTIIKFNLRTFGIGGLFGYFGYFNGNDIWYVTNLNKKVKITLKSGQIYMISPEKPEEFLNKINTNLNQY